MSKSKEKNSLPILWIGLIVVVVAAIGGYLMFAPSLQKTTVTAESEDKTILGSIDEAVEKAKQKKVAQFDYAPLSGVKPVKEINVETALKERVLGSVDAPIRFAEHSSFTCGHCSNFHKSTLPQIKEQYIDTGKAYMVFDDFPLNAPALHSAMVARCLPEEQFFNFAQMLFVKQNEWAFNPNYKEFLQKKSEKYGLPKELFNECITNQEIQKGILSRVRAIQGQWNIGSTPSFVIDNKEVITGNMPFETFQKAFNDVEIPAAAKEPKSVTEESAVEAPAKEKETAAEAEVAEPEVLAEPKIENAEPKESAQ